MVIEPTVEAINNLNRKYKKLYLTACTQLDCIVSLLFIIVTENLLLQKSRTTLYRLNAYSITNNERPKSLIPLRKLHYTNLSNVSIVNVLTNKSAKLSRVIKKIYQGKQARR